MLKIMAPLHVLRGIPKTSLSGKPLVQVVEQGSLFSQISHILLNLGKFSQILGLRLSGHHLYITM